MAGRAFISFGAVVALLTAPSLVLAQSAGDIDAAVQAAMTASQTPSASVAVVKDGKVVYARAFGDAILSPEVAATPATRYQIASVSKEFTAAAVLLLQEDGKLSLDDTVAKWFPDLTSADKITVRQLLSHTSGYSDYWPQDYVMTMVTLPTTPQAVMDAYAKAPLDYQPGDDWQYSNTGYVVAGQIVEKASGQPLFQFLQERILKPVGINDAFDITDANLTAPDAMGYQRQGLGPNRPAPLAGRGWTYAAWPLALTAEDVAKWDASILKRSLLKPSSYDTQVQTIKLNNGKDSGYAMGLFVRSDNGHRMYQHGGEGAGFLSDNRIYPDDNLAIVVLTNTMSGSAHTDIADRISFMYLPLLGPDATVLALFEGLQAGQVDRAGFTANFNAYLTDTALADFQANLGSLGKPVTFKLAGSSLRGGMEARSYRVRTQSGKLVSVSVYLTKDGKIEQFLVSLPV